MTPEKAGRAVSAIKDAQLRLVVLRTYVALGGIEPPAAHEAFETALNAMAEHLDGALAELMPVGSEDDC